MISHLTDAEIEDICRPLVQHAAQVRYLRSLGLRVDRRPDGSPLVRRSDWDQRDINRPANGPHWSREA